MSSAQCIGHYRIVSKLGEGGMGAVYRATDSRLNRDVAVKILPPAFAEDTGRIQRFEREAQVLASLNHPNIAAIYGIEQGAIVMELVEGVNLAGPVAVDTAIGYIIQPRKPPQRCRIINDANQTATVISAGQPSLPL